MASNNLYTSDNKPTVEGESGSKVNGEKTALSTLKSKLSSTKLGGLGDTASDMVQNFSDLGKSSLSSINDKFKSSNNRNVTESDFLTEDVSIENRHKDAISGILKDTYNGNLWDAGISAVNLYNVGTKWKIHLDQHVDKDSYSFKYYYLQSSDEIDSNGRDTAETDDNSIKRLKMLDSIEDPTILSTSFRIDPSSQLFKGATVPNPKPKRASAETNDPTINNEPSHNIITSSDLIKFISAYKTEHPEMEYAIDYLDEFKNGILKIFESPQTLDDGRKYNNELFKNHYVLRVDGLEKLDNLFVEYKNADDRMFTTEQESLTFLLNEDVRMFTNRLAFLYRNLTYSYSMGKKIIPENLLRFNLYIKVSDMRNFTSGIEESDLRTAIRDEYSRVIYELKDCEFFFYQSLNPNSLNMGGFSGMTTDYASLQLKVKYRKVNRIFYSSFYDNSFRKFLIGDKFYKPSIEANNKFLEATKFGSKNTKKRAYTSNNIPKTQGLGEKLDTLKNVGLLNTDNNDTALGRFAKTIGNDAVKSGAQVVSDGVQSLKDTANDKIGGSVRSFLQNKVSKKSLDLGYRNNKVKQVREIKTNMSIQTPLTDEPDFRYTINDEGVITNVQGIPSSASYEYNSNTNPLSNIILNSNNPITTHKNNDDGKILVPGTSDAFSSKEYKYKPTNPIEDLHPDVPNTITKPKEDLHPDVPNTIVKPSEDLHPKLNRNIISPDEDLHPNLPDVIINPDEDLHPNLPDVIINPDEDLHPTLNRSIDAPNEDLHPTMNNLINNPDEDLHPNMENNMVDPKEDLHPTIESKSVSPNEDLHQTTKHSIKSPNEDLHIVGKYKIAEPNEDLMEGNGEITQPKENLYNSSDNKITDPKDNVNSKIKNKMEDPKGDVNPDITHKYVQPDEFHDLKSFKDFLKKNKGGKKL